MKGYFDRLAERARGLAMPALAPAPPREDGGPADPFETVAPLEMQTLPTPAVRPAEPARERVRAPEPTSVRVAAPEVAPPPTPVAPIPPQIREEPSPRPRRRPAPKAAPKPDVVRRIEITESHVRQTLAPVGPQPPEKRATAAKIDPPRSRGEANRAPLKIAPAPSIPAAAESKPTTTRVIESRVVRIEPPRVTPAPVAAEPAPEKLEEPRLVIGRLDVEVIPHAPAAPAVREVVRVVERRGARRQTNPTFGASRLGYGLEQM